MMDAMTWTCATVDYDAIHNNGFAAQTRNEMHYKAAAYCAAAILRRQWEDKTPLYLGVYNLATEVVTIKHGFDGKIHIIYDKDLMDNELGYILRVLRATIKSFKT